SVFEDTVEEMESHAELACSVIPSHALGAANCTVSHMVDAFSLIVSHVREAMPLSDSNALPKCSLKPSKSPEVNAKIPLRTSRPALAQSARFSRTVSKALEKTSQTPDSARPRAPSGLIPRESQMVLNKIGRAS